MVEGDWSIRQLEVVAKDRAVIVVWCRVVWEVYLRAIRVILAVEGQVLSVLLRGWQRLRPQCLLRMVYRAF